MANKGLLLFFLILTPLGVYGFCSQTEDEIRDAMSDFMSHLPPVVSEPPTEPPPGNGNPPPNGSPNNPPNTPPNNPPRTGPSNPSQPPRVDNPSPTNPTRRRRGVGSRRPRLSNPRTGYGYPVTQSPFPISVLPAPNQSDYSGSQIFQADRNKPRIQLDLNRLSDQQVANVFKEFVRQSTPLKADPSYYDQNHDNIRQSLSYIIDQNNATQGQLQVLQNQLNQILVDQKAVKGKGGILFTPGRQPTSMPPDKPIPLKVNGDESIIDQVINAIVNNRYRSPKEWIQVASIKRFTSTAAGVKYNHKREVYWSNLKGQKGKIRVMEMKNSKNKTHSVLVFAQSESRKKNWLPYYFDYNREKKTFERYNSYYGTKLPNACVRCHGGSLKQLTPNVTIKGFEPTGWFFK